MDAGQTVYRGNVCKSLRDDGTVFWYVDEAQATGIECDGVEMVKAYRMLLPADGYVATKIEAKQQIVDGLVRMAGVIQRQIDAMKDEILHDTLTTEEAVA